MRSLESTAEPSILPGPVRVVVRSKAQCVGDPRLLDFDCGRSPATAEVRMIVENLYSGDALEQTVAMLTDDGTGELLGIASVRVDGNAQIRSKSSTPWFLRRLAGNPYVNVVARDERFRNRLLCDGRTRLGAVLVRAAVEVIEHELPDGPTPTIWALIRRHNLASKRAFRQLAFYPHSRSAENQQDVFVRRAGRVLPAAPESGAYLPPLSSRQMEHLTA